LPTQAYSKLKKPKGFKRFISSSPDPTGLLNPDQKKVVVGHFLPISIDALFSDVSSNAAFF